MIIIPCPQAPLLLPFHWLYKEGVLLIRSMYACIFVLSSVLIIFYRSCLGLYPFLISSSSSSLVLLSQTSMSNSALLSSAVVTPTYLVTPNTVVREVVPTLLWWFQVWRGDGSKLSTSPQ